MPYDATYGHIAKPTTIIIETEDADLIVTLVRNSNQKYHRIAEREFVFTDSQWSIEKKNIHGQFRLMEIKHTKGDLWPPPFSGPEELKPYYQVNQWVPIETRPLVTGYYLVGHRGHQERLLFMGPEKEWVPGTNIGWNRMGRRGWERDDPVERFRATRCMLIQFPDDGEPS